MPTSALNSSDYGSDLPARARDARVSKWRKRDACATAPNTPVAAVRAENGAATSRDFRRGLALGAGTAPWSLGNTPFATLNSVLSGKRRELELWDAGLVELVLPSGGVLNPSFSQK